MRELFWRSISYIYMDKDNKYIAFISNGIDFKDNRCIAYTSDKRDFWVYEAMGWDYYSHSWFESITNPENMIDSKIMGIEKKPEKSWGARPYRFISVYGYTFKTLKGCTDIEFRNENNGYYDGWCEYRSDAKLIFPETEDRLFGENAYMSNKMPIKMKIGVDGEEIELYSKTQD